MLVSMTMLSALVAMSTGCAMFRISVKDRDPEKKSPLSASYDHSDLLEWGELVSKGIMKKQFPGNVKPRLVDMGIQNRTRSHLDMKALSDTITTKLLDNGKVRLVNAARRDDLLKEQGYQLANCTSVTRAKIGQQLGANYMLTGSLVEITHESGREIRVSKKKDVYYQLTVEVTDVTTGEIVMRHQEDRLRRSSKPIIGW